MVTPDAAIEPGYRTYRIETHSGEMHDGFLIKKGELGTTLGFMGGVQIFIESKNIRRARFLDKSFMLPGLLDSLDEQLIADLFAYIASLN